MKKIRLFGFNFWDAKSEQEVVDRIMNGWPDSLFEKDNINFLLTPNAFDITHFFTGPRATYQGLKNSGIVLADGVSITLFSRIFKRPLSRRITGSNLFPVLWKRIIKERKKAFFILPNERIGRLICREYPSCDFAAPELFDENDHAYIRQFVKEQLDKIIRLKPDYLFLGLGTPKQQKMALELHHALSGKVDFNCIIANLGASFEFYLGIKKRAPEFFQRTGTEWLYRLFMEPGRLWKRYTIGNIKFLKIALHQLIKEHNF